MLWKMNYENNNFDCELTWEVKIIDICLVLKFCVTLHSKFEN